MEPTLSNIIKLNSIFLCLFLNTSVVQGSFLVSLSSRGQVSGITHPPPRPKQGYKLGLLKSRINFGIFKKIPLATGRGCFELFKEHVNYYAGTNSQITSCLVKCWMLQKGPIPSTLCTQNILLYAANFPNFPLCL